MLIFIFINSLQFYLPDEGVINKDFLKDVLAGKKQLFKKQAVTTIEVPHYDELSVKKIFPELKGDKAFMSYFPDKFPKGKGPPRDYFFNILNTLYPDYLGKLMEHAAKQRMTTEGEEMQKQSIEISYIFYIFQFISQNFFQFISFKETSVFRREK